MFCVIPSYQTGFKRILREGEKLVKVLLNIQPLGSIKELPAIISLMAGNIPV